MKFRFIDQHRGTHSVGKMARMLGVSRGGYYVWRSRAACRRAVEQEELVELIETIQKRVNYRYGSPRVTAELRKEGMRVGKNRIARLMSLHGLGARLKKPFRSTTDSSHSLPVAGNLLKRDFQVERTNQVWVSDITYIPTAEGWVYLCTVMDLYSRMIVGWSMGGRMRSELVVQALLMALMRRRPPGGLIFHSDRGSQYCSHLFRGWTLRYGIRQSMSRKGNPWDNAPAESFFKTLKGELYGHRAFRSRREARTVIFEYIEVFYNRERLHSTLGFLSPMEFERRAEVRAA